MTIIAYILAIILFTISVWMAPIHLRPLPRYLKMKFANFYVLRGISFSILTVLSIFVSIRTFIEPNLFWLFTTLIFIFITIWGWIYMIRDISKDFK